MNLRGRFLGVLLGAAALLVSTAGWAGAAPAPVVAAAVVAVAGHVHNGHCGHYRVYYHGGWYYWIDGSWELWSPVTHVWVAVPAYRAPVYVRHFEVRAKGYHRGHHKVWHKGGGPGHHGAKGGPHFKGGKGR